MTDNSHYVKPEEADKKICPMRMIDNELSFCDGPSCMAWRWAYNLSTDDDGQIEAEYSTTHGYCGMVRL